MSCIVTGIWTWHCSSNIHMSCHDLLDRSKEQIEVANVKAGKPHRFTNLFMATAEVEHYLDDTFWIYLDVFFGISSMSHDISTSLWTHLSSDGALFKHPCPGCTFVQIRPGWACESFRVSLVQSGICESEMARPQHHTIWKLKIVRCRTGLLHHLCDSSVQIPFSKNRLFLSKQHNQQTRYLLYYILTLPFSLSSPSFPIKRTFYLPHLPGWRRCCAPRRKISKRRVDQQNDQSKPASMRPYAQQNPQNGMLKIGFYSYL